MYVFIEIPALWRCEVFSNYANFIQEEKTKCNKYADELAKMELKWKEQVKIAENVKLELAEVEDNYKVSFTDLMYCA